ncbi:hypothetical protein NBRC116494_21410 [Aurantivibrio plasticivorans]
MAEPKHPLAIAAKRYIGDALGEQAIGRLQAWQGAKALPFYLQERYRGYTLALDGTPTLMACHVSHEIDTPAAIAKHLQAYRKAFDGEVFVVLENITSANRKRLIEQKVPFVVPQKQLYLPQFATVLSEFYKKSYERPVEQLSPVAQVLLLRFLIGLYPKPKSALVLAEQLGYSKMTLSRAINELVELELAETVPVGREKRLTFNEDGVALWEKAFAYLVSPVQKTVTIKKTDADKLLKKHKAVYAGESALSHTSLLSEPAIPVIATAANTWKNHNSKNENLFFEDFWVLQLWRYDPGLITRKDKNTITKDYVDNLSLYLSLKDEKDERIQIALDGLLKASLNSYVS